MTIATCADLNAAIAAFLNCGNLSAQIPPSSSWPKPASSMAPGKGFHLRAAPHQVAGKFRHHRDFRPDRQPACGISEARRFRLNSDPVQELT